MSSQSLPEPHSASSNPEDRFPNFETFWPYYLQEHSVPRCRHLHFIGTNGFSIYLLYLMSQNYVLIPVFCCTLLLARWAFPSEAKKNAAWVLLIMVALMVWIETSFIYGVIFAYFFAWIGHFMIEHNRPATFQYTLWSLAGDFKMCAQMWQGRLWSGSTREVNS